MPEPAASVKALFDQAVELATPAEREAFLDQACANAPEMRQKIDALLAAHDQAGSFLESPAPPPTEDPPAADADPPTAATLPPRPIAEKPGSRIGPYKLLQQIGEGGMGIVYMAEQTQPVRRRVALKIIKPGMDSAHVIARFEAERQALAMMDHLNIARVLDAGATESGRPYFVMELVHGVPITRYCDENKLTPRERLELFVPVCQALQHAHQKGIIHRDVKPSNVLVTLYDGKPVPKVIDFGVAKAIEQNLTERTMFTQFGAIVGTLEYMAPEQAEMSGLGVDTRSDIYSLGVLLYELLTGTTPVEQREVRELAYVEIVRMIKEDEPPRPSTRLSTTEQLATIAAARRTPPRELARLVRGELDWIVMKALEKDRTRRYETASGLARDVERYLHDEPVEAGPPSASYRLRKIARRYRRALLVAAAFAVLLVAGAAVSAWEAMRARQAEQTALHDRDRAVAAEETAHQEKKQAVAAEAQADAALEQAQKALYVNQIASAKRYWDANDLGKADKFLDACPAKLRDWEWHFMKRLFHSEITTLPGHQAAYSPDGKLLATVRRDDGGTTELLEIRDAQTFKVSTLLSDRLVVLHDLAFSPDSQRLVAVSRDDVRVWNIATGREAMKLRPRAGERAGERRAAFSPDSKRIALGEWTSRESTPGKSVHEIVMKGQEVTRVTLSFRSSQSAMDQGTRVHASVTKHKTNGSCFAAARVQSEPVPLYRRNKHPTWDGAMPR